MSPLAWIVHVPLPYSWLPAGTPGPPMSAQVKPPGQIDGGGVVTAATFTAAKVAGVVAPVVPVVAASPAREFPEPMSRATLEPSTGVHVLPSAEVRVEK